MQQAEVTDRPEPSAIKHMASPVAIHIPTQQLQDYHIYRDNLIQIALDSKFNSVSIRILRKHQEAVVFQAEYKNDTNPSRYNPGPWTQYLKLIAGRAQKAKDKKALQHRRWQAERYSHLYGPIDDTDLFAGHIPTDSQPPDEDPA